MHVRLAFSVAAHLDPEILIVDEVLAVGDSVFQKKCLGKMKEISEGGRTVLFVSHNLGVLKSLCKTGIVLVNGEMSGTKKNIQYAIDEYLKMNYLINENLDVRERNDRAGSGEIKITKIRLNNSDCEIDSDIPMQLIINYDALYQSFRGLFLISINTLDNQCVFFLDSSLAENNPVIFKKQGEIKIQLSGEISLAPNKYFINIAAYVNGVLGDYIKQAQLFTVRQGTFFINGKMPMGKSILLVKQNWTFNYD
jgi:lipopolysaccharide transport system ATP-binding protein